MSRAVLIAGIAIGPEATTASAVDWEDENCADRAPGHAHPFAPSSTTTSPTAFPPLVDRLAVSTPLAVFEAHMRKLARDYEVVSLDAVLSGKLPPRALLITFDDGYRSFVESALPVLRRLGLPSVLVHHRSVPRSRHPPAGQPPLVPLREHRPGALGGGARPRRARDPRTFLQLLDLVAAMPYGRLLAAGRRAG